MENTLAKTAGIELDRPIKYEKSRSQSKRLRVRLRNIWKYIVAKLDEGAAIHNRQIKAKEEHYQKNWYYIRSLMVLTVVCINLTGCEIPKQKTYREMKLGYPPNSFLQK